MLGLFKPGSIIVVVGPGGVGKTTIAASLSIACAQSGLATQVITIDPARRLRDALGLGSSGGRPLKLDSRRLRAAGLDPHLDVTAMMLDTQRLWAGFVKRFVLDSAKQKLILSNEFYLNLTRNFPGADGYAALEQMYEIHENRASGVAIVDTPPTAQAFDFIEAPSRLADLLTAPSARWLFRFARDGERGAGGIAGKIGEAIVQQIEHFAGLQPLSTVAQFFSAAAGAVDGMAERMRATQRLLHSPAIRFLLVTTSEQSRLGEAREIIQRMWREGLLLSGIVINRALDQIAFDHAREMNLQSYLAETASWIAEQNQKTSRAASLLEFLAKHTTETRAMVERLRGFFRALPAGVDLQLVPHIDPSGDGLRALSQIAAILTRADSGEQMLRGTFHNGRRNLGDKL